MKSIISALLLCSMVTVAYASGPQPGENHGDFDGYFVQKWERCAVYTDLIMMNPNTGTICGSDCQILRAVWVLPHPTLENRFKRDPSASVIQIRQGRETSFPSIVSAVSPGRRANTLKVVYRASGMRFSEVQYGNIFCGY